MNLIASSASASESGSSSSALSWAPAFPRSLIGDHLFFREIVNLVEKVFAFGFQRVATGLQGPSAHEHSGLY